MGGARLPPVVAVKEVAASVPKDEWSEDRLLPGDIIEKIAFVDGFGLASPFSRGKAGLENELRQIFRSTDELSVWVRRGFQTMLELKACVIPEESVIPKKHYTLRYYNDFRHVVQLVDSTEEECSRWQESTRKILRNAVQRRLSALRSQENLLPYAWRQKMQASLPVENSSMIFSMLFMPFQPSPDRLMCKDLENTIARALAWFCSAQASGVPMIFVSIQTELIFKEGSKECKSFFDTAGKEPVQQFTTCGRFKIVCSENTVIDIAKAVRLWYVPAAAEVAVDLILKPGELRFGLCVASNEEGFCYVSSVDEGGAADRCGVKTLWETAGKASKLLVVSRVAEEKVVPWLAACSGSIHCFGATAIQEQLSVLREFNKSARVHFMVWEGTGMAETMIPVGSNNNNNNNNNNININNNINVLHEATVPEIIGSTTVLSSALKSSSELASTDHCRRPKSLKPRSVSWSDVAGCELAVEGPY